MFPEVGLTIVFLLLAKSPTYLRCGYCKSAVMQGRGRFPGFVDRPRDGLRRRAAGLAEGAQGFKRASPTQAGLLNPKPNLKPQAPKPRQQTQKL